MAVFDKSVGYAARAFSCETKELPSKMATMQSLNSLIAQRTCSIAKGSSSKCFEHSNRFTFFEWFQACYLFCINYWCVHPWTINSLKTMGE
jgi:hypothetical protein